MSDFKTVEDELGDDAKFIMITLDDKTVLAQREISETEMDVQFADGSSGRYELTTPGAAGSVEYRVTVWVKPIS